MPFFKKLVFQKKCNEEKNEVGVTLYYLQAWQLTRKFQKGTRTQIYILNLIVYV